MTTLRETSSIETTNGNPLNLERLLRCPLCGTEIDLGPVQAECASGHRFPVDEGVPVFTVDANDPHYEQQRSYFDAEFAAYTRYGLENWRKSYLDRLRHAGLVADGAVIDVGVGGSGYTVIEAARSGSPAVGCDLSLRGLKTARGFALSQGVDANTRWVCCSAERLPFADAAFSAAFAIAVLEHVPDDKAALAEIARILEPGGRAWVTVPHALRNISIVFRSANRRHDRRLGHLRRYEAEDLLEAGRRAGLTAEEVQFTGHPVKVLQLAGAPLGDRFWWWCERRDLRRREKRRGSMQLTVLFTRAG